MIPVTCFAGRKVAVFGLGKSGLAAVDALLAGGAQVIAWDDNETARAALAEREAEAFDLRFIDFVALDALVLAPGVPLTHPEPHWTVEKAHKSGVEIIGDTELFVRELAHRATGAKLVAITGTNGKSTTTALIGHVLDHCGRKVAVGGNIGTAVLSLDPPEPDMVYVLEFSSFQIDLTPGLKPDVAILLNVSPDHLDRHGDIETYTAVKARIFALQGPDDCAVIALDDEICRGLAEDLPGNGRKVEIAGEHQVQDGYVAEAGRLYAVVNGERTEIADLTDAVALRGDHNGQNAAAAASAAVALGIDRDRISPALASFPGLAHRMQQVARVGEVVFINDSKATNADAAARALSSFDRIYWIAGGLAKSGGIENLKEFFPKIEKAYLIGDAADAFARTLDGHVASEVVGTLERAVDASVRDIEASGQSDAVVLFSPACASFDQYRNFELRGNAFCEAVYKLRGVTRSKGT